MVYIKMMEHYESKSEEGGANNNTFVQSVS